MKNNSKNMTQQEIDSKMEKLSAKRHQLQKEMDEVNQEIRKLSIEQFNVDDPHALIPKSYKSISDWIEGHPFPNTVISMIFQNRTKALMAQKSCNSFQENYHVVRCSKRSEKIGF